MRQLDTVDRVRREVAPGIAQKRKSELGQFMTPSSVARFMAGMFPTCIAQTCRLLDAGAGVGALSCAFLDRWLAGGFGFKTVEATAYEVDETLRGHLRQHLASYRKVKAEVIAGDYIELATAKNLQAKGFTHAILNPPYKKIHSNSAHRLALRSVGIETVNLYSAFVALAVAQAAPGGQIVAIIPRSFCMGRTTARSGTSSLSVQPSARCTCLSHAARHSRTTKCCKRTSLSALSEAAGRGR